MSQPPTKGKRSDIPALKEIKVIDVTIQKCGKFAEDEKFSNVCEEIRSGAKNEAAENQDSNSNPPEPQENQSIGSQDAPREAVFFRDDYYEIVADFKTIPTEEIYCRVSEGCVEIGAVHKETQGSGPTARHLDLQLTRLYQTPRAINVTAANCYLSSDGVLLVAGPYKGMQSQQEQEQPPPEQQEQPKQQVEEQEQQGGSA